MKLLHVLFSFVLIHLVYTVFGRLLVGFNVTHKLGLRLMAMGFFPNSCLKHCRLDCDNVHCGNWTCPNYGGQSK